MIGIQGDADALVVSRASPELAALISVFPVELSGIEPSPKISLTCRNLEFDDAKRLESTRTDLGIRERC